MPWGYPGANRRVYPGFLQLAAFISMNLDRHVTAHLANSATWSRRGGRSAEAHRPFYDEYFAVMDLPAEFYLETVKRMFQEHHLAAGA